MPLCRSGWQGPVSEPGIATTCGSPLTRLGLTMGNCITRGKPKADRVAAWEKTGIVGLRDLNLEKLPAEVEAVGPKLRTIDATNNKIRSLPDTLATLSHLQRLVLASNVISSLPDSLAELSSLRLLNLDSNALTHLPDSLGSLSRLDSLSVANNKLQTLPATIGGLSSLKLLNISGNALGELPSTVGSCVQLEEIDASSNSLTALPAELGQLQKLKKLLLSANRLAAVPSAIFTGCTALQTISLHNNPVTIQDIENTEGYTLFEERRKGRLDKAIASGVLLGASGLDEGIDRKLLDRR